jgi:hypothetical protein
MVNSPGRNPPGADEAGGKEVTAKRAIVERWGGSVKEDWGLKVASKPADNQALPDPGKIGSLRRKGGAESSQPRGFFRPESAGEGLSCGLATPLESDCRQEPRDTRLPIRSPAIARTMFPSRR